ncbi:MAG: glycerate 2-kinase [Planctomycetota bacterium]|nr:MAG: glycerate 2-kinase [Planctomycetota bacterium]
MKILIASDSFKGTLTSTRISQLFIKQFDHQYTEVTSAQISDGGEGLLIALEQPYDLEIQKVSVIGPLGITVQAKVGTSEKHSLLVVEMAEASGLPLIQESLRDPLTTTSYGTGQLLLLAKENKYKNILLGVGGSATSDGGIGALQALGIQIDDIPDKASAKDLINIKSFNIPTNFWLKGKNIQIACDVNNPFTGINGAAKIYGPQKCNPTIDSSETIEQVEEGMIHLQSIIKQQFDIDLNHVQGSGAAGGIAGSFHAILKASLTPGTDIIFDAIQLEKKIEDADLIITGEGCLDHQTLNGKVIAGISHLTKKHHKTLIGICGQNNLSKEELHQLGIQKVFSLTDFASIEDCMNNTESVFIKLLDQLAVTCLS